MYNFLITILNVLFLCFSVILSQFMSKDPASTGILSRLCCIYTRYYRTLRIGLYTWTCAMVNVGCITIAIYLYEIIEMQITTDYTLSEAIIEKCVDLDSITSNQPSRTNNSLPSVLVPLCALGVAFRRRKKK